MTPGGGASESSVRVLVVMDSTGGGGAERSMAALAPLMARHGVEMEFAYFIDRPGVKDALVAAGIPLWHVPARRSRLGTVRSLRRLLAERRPDVVHTCVYEADIIGRPAAWTSGIPVMSSIINEMYGPAQYSGTPSRWRMRLAQLADVATARCVTHFHAVSATVAAAMAPRLRIDPSSITVIPRGRDLDGLGRRTTERRAGVRRSLGLSPQTAVVLAVGRHERQKGFDTLLDAVPAVVDGHPDVKVLVAGRDGAATPELRRRLDEMNVPRGVVDFLGERTDIADLLCAADVVAMPSRWEGAPGTLIEAMALECPIVCSDLPMIREVVDVGGGVAHYVPIGDADTLATELLGVLAERADVERPPLERFDLDAIARQHADVYRSVAR